MKSSTLRGRVLGFHSTALPPNTFEVVRVHGHEELSSPFRFELDLLSRQKDMDTTSVVQRPARLTVKMGVPLRGSSARGVRTLSYHGVVSSVEQAERLHDWVLFKLVLLPRLSRLSMNLQSRIFLDRSVPQIVEQVLLDAGLQPEDFQFALSARSYSPREYVAQYEESDLDFVSRLLEHEGIFYFFRQLEDREVVVFGDLPAAYSRETAIEPLRFRQQDPVGLVGTLPGDSWFEGEFVRSFSFRHRSVPREVLLRDYNYRSPGVDLHASAPVVPHGIGRVYRYGEHFKDPESGSVLAQIRAEEFRCRERLFHGAGDAKWFHPGLTFELSDHYRNDFNREYVLVEVDHTLEQVLPLGAGAGPPRGMYANEFVAIPSDVPFRPARRTPKPVAGPLNAHVDASGSGEYAEIDDEGRYKVRLPLDLSGRGGAHASRFLRMAQPYAGGGHGMHFPLHKGTEVVITHIHGDPDRPMIASAIPNPLTASMVTGANHRKNVVKSASGNMFTLDDDAGGVHASLLSPAHATQITLGEGPAAQGIRMETEKDHIREIARHDEAHVGGNLSHRVDGTADTTTQGNASSTFLSKVKSTILGKLTQVALNHAVELIKGNKAKVVGGNVAQMTRGLHALQTGRLNISSRTSAALSASDNASLLGKNVFVLGSDEITLMCGNIETTCTWTRKDWTLESEKVLVTARETFELNATKQILLIGQELVWIESPKKVAVLSGNETYLYGPKLNLETSGTMTVTGKMFVNGTNLIVET